MMEKSIWIKVDKLRLEGLKKSQILDLKDNEKYARGNLEIGSQGFISSSLLITLREEDNLSQNYAHCNMRFLDVPARHRLERNGQPPRRRMLEDIIALAVADEYLRKRKNELIPLLNNRGDSFSFPWFTPPAWQGSLRIPVEFIRLFNFECAENGPVYANVQIGHHLVFWNVLAYDQRRRNPFKFENKNIRDQEVLLAINRLLTKKKVRGYMEKLIQTCHYISDETEFIDKIPGSSPNGLPPRIRFY
jgi:hypothetical protein